jgi:hypothetical protein
MLDEFYGSDYIFANFIGRTKSKPSKNTLLDVPYSKRISTAYPRNQRTWACEVERIVFSLDNSLNRSCRMRHRPIKKSDTVSYKSSTSPVKNSRHKLYKLNK